MKLRNWQADCIDLALAQYQNDQNHFLALATPGAGKTLMATELADSILKRDLVDLIICFSPSSIVAQDFTESLQVKIQERFDGLMGARGRSITYQNLQYLDANFWQDKVVSKKIVKEKKLFEDLLFSHEKSIKKLKDLDDLNELANEENNTSIVKEVFENLKDLRQQVTKNEIKCFLSNEADSLDCYIEIHAGAGGTESQDWANMLRRMYLKF